MDNPAKAAASSLKAMLGSLVEEIYEDARGVVVRVSPAALIDALSALKANSNTPFEMLVDATAVDWSTWAEETDLEPPRARFSLYYNLFSLTGRARIFIETCLDDGESAPSATSVYASADWAEREIFDMFGIKFAGHPDLRRILMPEDYVGFPLRKEFPALGPDPQDFPQE